MCSVKRRCEASAGRPRPAGATVRYAGRARRPGSSTRRASPSRASGRTRPGWSRSAADRRGSRGCARRRRRLTTRSSRSAARGAGGSPSAGAGSGTRWRRRPPAIRTSLRVGQPPPGDRQGIRRGRIRGRRRRARRDLVRPRRKDEDGDGPRLAPLRQRIESIFWTCKDILALERHGARTLRGLRVRIAARFLALAAAVSLNHELGRPSRALVDYVT